MENGKAIFRTIMPLKVFHIYSRPARHITDKVVAIREVWDEWMERFPQPGNFYNPGPEMTVDDELVLFRGCGLSLSLSHASEIQDQVMGGMRCQIQLCLEDASLHQ